MQRINQYDMFELAKDVNSVIRAGMKGVILEIWSEKDCEVEFVKEDGTNYEFEGHFTFTIDISYIGNVWPGNA